MGTIAFNQFQRILDRNVEKKDVLPAVGKVVKQYIADRPHEDEKGSEDHLEELFSSVKELAGIRKRSRRSKAGTNRTQDELLVSSHEETIKNWCRTVPRGDEEFVQAVYFWFHVRAEDCFYAQEIDKALFGEGVSFEKRFNSQIPDKLINTQELKAVTDQNEKRKHFTCRGTLIDFFNGTDENNHLEIEVAVKEGGKLVIFHNRLFNRHIRRLDFWVSDKRLVFTAADDSMRYFGLPLAENVVGYIKDSREALLVFVPDDKKDVYKETGTVPLFVYP